MKVFVAGPRAVSALNKNVINVLSRIVEQQLTVLLGDANGVDRLVQNYFAEEKYPNVYVYASNGKARNNVGDWTVNSVEVPSDIKGFNFYAQKDIQMAQDADNGFMIWNGKSKGTLNNIINLTSKGKKTIIYLMPTKKTYCIDKLCDVETMAISMGAETFMLFKKLCPPNVNLNKHGNYEQLSLSDLL